MHRNQNYLQKDRKVILHDPHYLGVPSGASEMISEAMVRLVQTVDLSCTETHTISKSNENKILHDPRHLGVPSGASRTISELTVRMVQTMQLSRTETNTISKRTE
jgi:hypothetical protein